MNKIEIFLRRWIRKKQPILSSSEMIIAVYTKVLFSIDLMSTYLTGMAKGGSIPETPSLESKILENPYS